jgi:hypothetical protein
MLRYNTISTRLRNLIKRRPRPEIGAGAPYKKRKKKKKKKKVALVVLKPSLTYIYFKVKVFHF